MLKASTSVLERNVYLSNITKIPSNSIKIYKADQFCTYKILSKKGTAHISSGFHKYTVGKHEPAALVTKRWIIHYGLN